MPSHGEPVTGAASAAASSARAESGSAALLARARNCERAGPIQEAHAAYEACVTAAARAGDHAVLAEALRRRAILSHEAGDDAAARAGLQQSYAVATLLGDATLAAEALNTLGGIELETGQLVAAESALTEAMSLSNRVDLTARIAQNLGIVANIRGDHPLAEQHYTRSLAAYAEIGDTHGCAIAYHNLGMVRADRGRWRDARESYLQCLALAGSSGDDHLEAVCLVNHAEALLALDAPAEARAGVERARACFERLRSRFDLADAERVLALIELVEGDEPAAEARLHRAIELAGETGNRLTEAEAARELGRLYAGTGRWVEAERHLRRAHRAFIGIGAAVDAAEVATILLRVEEAQRAG
jgi:tetratricopeptide (TPR) repeat protein